MTLQVAIAFFKPFDIFYGNPTTRQYHQILEAMPEVETVSLDGYSDFLRKGEAHDIVVFSPFVFLGKSREIFEKATARLRRAYYVPNLSSVRFDQCERYFDTFLKIRERAPACIVLMTEYDLHALSENDPLLSSGGQEKSYILMTGPELYDLDLHARSQSGTSRLKDDLDPVSVRRGYDILMAKKHQLLSFPHVLAAEEFCPISDIPQRKRLRRISIPGISYEARRAAIKEVVSQYPLEYGLQLVDRVAHNLLRQIRNGSLRQRLLWGSFRKSIAASRMTFTCGSTSGYLVRKFLEIPAFGSCLCTFNYAFLPRIGLKPGVHYLPINTVQEIEIYIKRLSDRQFLRHVTDCTLRAHRLILESHSAYARYDQLSKTLKRIAQGTFSGSYWENGEYKFWNPQSQ